MDAWLQWALDGGRAFGGLLWAWARENPKEAIFIVAAVVGLMGVVIDSGHRGVLYRFGRVRRVLEPGFHPLIPYVHQVKKVHTRSHTLDVPKQRATTADGFVYDLDVNVVYTIQDPVKAQVEVDALPKAITTVAAMVAQEAVRGRGRADLRDREDLDQALVDGLEPWLERWGARLDRAGFTSLAPSRETLRLTQLAAKVREREAVLRHLEAAGLRPSIARALLGADRRLVAKAHRRYRRPAPGGLVAGPRGSTALTGAGGLDVRRRRNP